MSIFIQSRSIFCDSDPLVSSLLLAPCQVDVVPRDARPFSSSPLPLPLLLFRRRSTRSSLNTRLSSNIAASTPATDGWVRGSSILSMLLVGRSNRPNRTVQQVAEEEKDRRL